MFQDGSLGHTLGKHSIQFRNVLPWWRIIRWFILYMTEWFHSDNFKSFNSPPGVLFNLPSRYLYSIDLPLLNQGWGIDTPPSNSTLKEPYSIHPPQILSAFTGLSPSLEDYSSHWSTGYAAGNTTRRFKSLQFRLRSISFATNLEFLYSLLFRLLICLSSTDSPLKRQS